MTTQNPSPRLGYLASPATRRPLHPYVHLAVFGIVATIAVFLVQELLGEPFAYVAAVALIVAYGVTLTRRHRG